MAGFATYSLIELVGSLNHPSVGSISIGGQAAGLGRVSFEWETDTTSLHRMPDGTIITNVKRGNQGRITLSVQQLSSYDEFLLSWQNTVKTALLNNAPAIAALGAAFFQDVTYGDSYTGAGISISKQPPMEYDDELAMRQWVLLVSDLNHES